MDDVKKATDRRNRRRGATRISSKHQVTIPVDALRAAGIEVGERVVARADGPGRVILEREDDVLTEFAGRLTGVYEDGELDRLRDEWA
jgi:bifunctional DNA-binding transcriptional regulator/antitoxin component of YhaV-PrlF toxin-antitoxin module